MGIRPRELPPPRALRFTGIRSIARAMAGTGARFTPASPTIRAELPIGSRRSLSARQSRPFHIRPHQPVDLADDQEQETFNKTVCAKSFFCV